MNFNHYGLEPTVRHILDVLTLSFSYTLLLAHATGRNLLFLLLLDNNFFSFLFFFFFFLFFLSYFLPFFLSLFPFSFSPLSLPSILSFFSFFFSPFFSSCLRSLPSSCMQVRLNRGLLAMALSEHTQALAEFEAARVLDPSVRPSLAKFGPSLGKFGPSLASFVKFFSLVFDKCLTSFWQVFGKLLASFWQVFGKFLAGQVKLGKLGKSGQV